MTDKNRVIIFDTTMRDGEQSRASRRGEKFKYQEFDELE